MRALVLIVAALHSPPAPRLAQSVDAARSRAVTEAVHHSGAVPRCWNAYLHAEPAAGSVRFRVRVDVAASGAFERVAVLDPVPLALAGCVRTQLAQVRVTA